MPTIQIPTTYLFTNEFGNQTYEVASTINNNFTHLTETITDLCNLTVTSLGECSTAARGISMYCSDAMPRLPAITAVQCGNATIDAGYKCITQVISYMTCPKEDFNATPVIVAGAVLLGIFAAGYGIYRFHKISNSRQQAEIAPLVELEEQNDSPSNAYRRLA